MADCTLGPTINLDLIKLVADQPGKDMPVNSVVSTDSADEAPIAESFAQVLEQGQSDSLDSQKAINGQIDALTPLPLEIPANNVADDDEVDPQALIAPVEQEIPTLPVLQVLKDELKPEDIKLYVPQADAEQLPVTQAAEESLWGSTAERVVFKTAGQTEINANAAPKFTEVIQQQAPQDELTLIQFADADVLDLVHEVDEGAESSEIIGAQDHEVSLVENDPDGQNIKNIDQALPVTTGKETTRVQENANADPSTKPAVEAISQLQDITGSVAVKSKVEAPIVMRAPQVAQDLAVHMKQALDAGEDRLTVQLNPPSLGKIEIEMQFAKDGRLHAILIADKPDTYDLLQKNPQMLKEAMAGSGLGADMTDLSFNLRQDHDETPANQNRSFGQANPIGLDSGSEAIVYRQAPSINPMKKVDINA